MKVVVLNLAHAAGLTRPEAILASYRLLREWAEALVEADLEVAVVQGFTQDTRLERNGVTYELVSGRFTPLARGRRLAPGLTAAVARHRPDVVHVNGLLFARLLPALREAVDGETAIVMQHHAEAPFRGLSGRLQRRGLAAADAFLFSGRELAQPWVESRLIDEDRVFEILEGSSRLTPCGRNEARARLRLTGDPLCVWLGNLDPNKDPLTVLDGFERLLTRRPGARLCMAWRSESLLDRVRRRLAASDRLRDAVQLLGTVPYDDLGQLLSACDLFLQGSAREGSGLALVDAMACGVVPVVTDIAPFRFITDGGKYGALWRRGDPDSLADALSAVLAHPLAPQRSAVRAYFDQALGYGTIGLRAATAYASAHRRRRDLFHGATRPAGSPARRSSQRR